MKKSNIKQTVIGIVALVLVIALAGLMYFSFVYKYQPKKEKPSIEITIDGDTYKLEKVN